MSTKETLRFNPRGYYLLHTNYSDEDIAINPVIMI